MRSLQRWSWRRGWPRAYCCVAGLGGVSAAACWLDMGVLLSLVSLSGLGYPWSHCRGAARAGLDAEFCRVHGGMGLGFLWVTVGAAGCDPSCA